MSENQNEQNNTVYDENQIQILVGLEAVRKKTGNVYRLYISERTASSDI